MAIEYAISAGEGTLIDYGVAYKVHYDFFGPAIIDWNYETESEDEAHPCDDVDSNAPVVLVAMECPFDCETGR